MQDRTRHILKLKHHLKMRIASKVAFGFKLLDKFFKWQLLMRVRAHRGFFYEPEKLTERRIAVKTRAQRERVYEKPDQPFDLLAVATGDWCSNNNVGLAGVTPQQDLKGGQQSHKERDPAFPA